MANPALRRVTPRRVVFAPFSAPDAGTSASGEASAAPTVEQVRAEASRAGYAEGLARGTEDGIRLLRDQSARLSGLLDRAVHDVGAAVVAIEPDVVELALAVAARVVHRQLTDEPDVVVAVVREALGAAGTVKLLRVRVHPDDEAPLRSIWERVAPAAPPVDLVPDPRVERGGCVVDTASGFVDGQPSVRLAEIRHQVLSRLGMLE